MPIIQKLLDFIPDPAQRQRAELEMQTKLMELSAQQATEQSDINKIEAANENVFVSGWRPAIGWVCAVAFAWNYVGFPIAEWLLVVFNVHTAPLKSVMDGNLMELTLGLLGLGAMRSFDKLKGVK